MTSRHVPLIASAFCVLLAIAASGCGSGSGAQTLEKAREAVEQKKYESAVLLLKTHLQEVPDSPAGRFLFGRALLESGDAAGAEVELSRALELGHPNAAVVPALAQALHRQGKHSALLVRFGTEELGEGAADQDLGTTVALALAATGQLDAARARLQSVLASRPDYEPALLALALVHSRTGEVDAAIATLDGLLQRVPGSIDGWQTKGDILLRQKRDLVGAAEAYTRGLVADPGNAGLHSSLISIYYLQQDGAAAERQFLAMKQAQPKHALTRYHEAKYAFQRGDGQTAAELLQPVLLAFPERIDVLYLAGAVDLQRGALSQAEAHVAKAVSLQPDAPAPRRLLAQLNLKANQPHKAFAIIRVAADRPDADPETLTLAAQAALLAADTKAADAYLARATRSKPTAAGARTSLALAQLARGGNAEAALADLQLVTASDSGTAADMALIIARLHRAEYDAALKAIDALDKKSPKSPVAPELRARVHLARKDAPAVRKAYEESLARQADYMPAVNGISALDLVEGKGDAAKARFLAVIKANPRNVEAYLSLAELEARTGAGKDAVARRIGEAVAANPADSAPRRALIEHHRRAGDTKATLDAAQAAVAALPGDPQLQDQLGRAQLATGDLNQAGATFGQLAAQQAQLAFGPLGLAEVALARKDFEGAARQAKRALELDPRSLEAKRVAIMASVPLKRYDDAVNVARTMQAEWPEESLGFILEGDVEWLRERWEAAAQAFRTATKKPNPAQSPGRLHASLIKANKAVEAARFADGWLADHPKDTLFMLYLADSAGREGDRVVAERRYRQVLAVQPENPVALNNMAVLLIQENKPGALDLANRAVKAAPNQLALQDTLASALAQAGQVPQAIDLQRKVVAAAPGVPGFRLNLARLHLQAGDKASARGELTTLSKVEKPFPGREELPDLMKRAGG